MKYEEFKERLTAAKTDYDKSKRAKALVYIENFVENLEIDLMDHINELSEPDLDKINPSCYCVSIFKPVPTDIFPNLDKCGVNDRFELRDMEDVLNRKLSHLGWQCEIWRGLDNQDGYLQFALTQKEV